MRTLQVTSPMMTGSDVVTAQRRLRANVFKQDYMQGGTQDGQFGPESGRACKRAKYWLGYKLEDMTATYGPFLNGYLVGEKELPDSQQAARKARAAAVGKQPLREKAFAHAVQDLGMREDPPDSNWSKISRRWGVQGPWCAMAVSCWYIDAGSKAFTLHRDWAYVPYMLTNAVQGNKGLAIAKLGNVKRGDIVTFDWQQNGEADHVGLFDHWLTQDRFATVEGNTSPTNWSNGGQVARMQRRVNQVARLRGQLGFIHVGT